MVDTLGFVRFLETRGIARREAEAYAEGMTQFLIPDLVTKDHFDKAIVDLNKAMSDLALKMILANLTIAGVTLALAGFGLAVYKTILG